MSKTNAERQAAYRARQLKSEDATGERLNLIIDLHAKRALERLSSCYQVTQRGLIEHLLMQAQSAALDKLEATPGGATDFYESKPPAIPMSLLSNGIKPATT